MPFGGGGSPSGNTTTVQKADPWEGIQPQLKQAAGDTQNLYNQGLLKQQFFPGNTVAEFAPQQQQAIDLTTQRALNGSPLDTANQGMLKNTLNGDYLDPSSNPYLKKTYDQASQAVQGTVNGSFGQGGRYGSGLNQDTLEKNLNNLATNIYGGNYTNERNNQLKAGLEAPGAANQDYTNISALANAGAQVQGQNQANITDQMNRFNFNQQQPSQNIANYVGLLNGAGGQYGSSTATSPYYQNNMANILGTGLGVAAGANALGGIGGLIGSTGSFGDGTYAGMTGASGLLGFLGL